MEVPAGQRNQYLVDVILEKEERETLRKLIQETVREELKSGDMERIPAWEKEEIPGQIRKGATIPTSMPTLPDMNGLWGR